MNTPCDKARSRHYRAAAFLCALVLTTPFVSMSSKAEIPHENYTLITQDMDVVVAMLNASIRASEDALRSFHSQDVDSAMGHIDVAASIIDGLV